MARERIRHGLSNIDQRQRLAGYQQEREYPGVRMRNPRQRAEDQPGTLIFGLPLPSSARIQRLFRQRLAQRTIAIHPGDSSAPADDAV